MKQKLLIERIGDTQNYLLNETIYDSIISAVATTIQHEDINDLEEDDLLKLVNMLDQTNNTTIERVLIYDYNQFNKVVAVRTQEQNYLISINDKHEYKLDHIETLKTLFITRNIEKIVCFIENSK